MTWKITINGAARGLFPSLYISLAAELQIRKKRRKRRRTQVSDVF